MLTDRFDDAFGFAASAHRSQSRKVSGVPYIAHLMSVSALTLEYGGDEDCAIAALLHDAVEDQGGMAMAETIGARFGSRVRGIVLECSDRTSNNDNAPWRTRKERYIAQIMTKSDDAILVTSCDKLHNASSIVADMDVLGTRVFDRFRGKRDGTLWYYRALADALSTRAPGPLNTRLSAVVSHLEAASR
ncbi:MAG: HD domain-containing protein [Roseobacter sp.]|jgi:(p)ppGpp synthase/HD superfamily hydrolase|nr:HD domain-containing protein [Roseobacter sp.]